AVTVEHLRNFDIGAMIRDTRSEKAQACGAGPMITAMMAARKLGAGTGRVLKYANSGDVSGDRSGVVGYVSAIFFE
ncbi:MAG TPA: AmmeMemoRadiSam system protein B, partial [Syntrophorhabdaceae bacterium]|nr:AmmeMemoRadiSam system protein B [Syntrophorhabdaceae bacterium]